MHPGVDLSIVIPAYNEQNRILSLLESLRRSLAQGAVGTAGTVEVLVVCDGCTDCTEKTVREWGGLSCLRVLGYPENRGKGHAVKTGILESRGGTVAFMDADGSTPVSELVRSMRPIQEGRADIVIGSRRAKGASIRVRQPLSRRLLGRAFGLCNRLFLGLPFLDTQCGFKVFRGDCGRELFREIATSGFAFDLEVLLAARAKGLRILEIGVAWNDTPGSTVSPVTDGLSMLRTAWQLRTRARHRGHGAPVSARPPLAPLSGSPAAPVRREGVTNHA